MLNLVLQELAVAGLSIPEDVSVLSCGTYLEGELMSRPVTEMPVMPEKLCSRAMRLLISAIEENAEIMDVVDLEAPVLKERGSIADIGRGDQMSSL